MLFLSNSQFVREFYLLVCIEKDSSIKKKKERKKERPLGPQSSRAGSMLKKPHNCKHRAKVQRAESIHIHRECFSGSGIRAYVEKKPTCAWLILRNALGQWCYIHLISHPST